MNDKFQFWHIRLSNHVKVYDSEVMTAKWRIDRPRAARSTTTRSTANSTTARHQTIALTVKHKICV